MIEQGVCDLDTNSNLANSLSKVSQSDIESLASLKVLRFIQVIEFIDLCRVGV